MHHDKMLALIKVKNFHFPLGLQFEYFKMRLSSLQIKYFTAKFPYFEFLCDLSEVTDLSFDPLRSLILT
jgi:hypothetical protein